MALYDEVRTIPYDSFDSQVECDKYDRASSAWDKFMQAAAIAKFYSNNSDRRGEEVWLLRALFWADCDSSCSEVAYALADHCDRYGVYISYCLGDDLVPTRMVRPRHLRRCHLWLPEDCGHRSCRHRGVVRHNKVHSSKISQLITNA